MQTCPGETPFYPSTTRNRAVCLRSAAPLRRPRHRTASTACSASAARSASLRSPGPLPPTAFASCTSSVAARDYQGMTVPVVIPVAARDRGVIRGDVRWLRVDASPECCTAAQERESGRSTPALLLHTAVCRILKTRMRWHSWECGLATTLVSFLFAAEDRRLSDSS